jgi:hypothetical protein
MTSLAAFHFVRRHFVDEMTVDKLTSYLRRNGDRHRIPHSGKGLSNESEPKLKKIVNFLRFL